MAEQHNHNGDDEQVEDRPAFENHFISGDREQVTIRGATFTLREMKGDEIDRMKSEAQRFEDDGSWGGVDIGKKHNVLLKNTVVDAPYDSGYLPQSNKDPGEGTAFKNLGSEDRLNILNNLTGAIREQLIEHCNQMQGLSQQEKKESDGS